MRNVRGRRTQSDHGLKQPGSLLGPPLLDLRPQLEPEVITKSLHEIESRLVVVIVHEPVQRRITDIRLLSDDLETPGTHNVPPECLGQ